MRKIKGRDDTVDPTEMTLSQAGERGYQPTNAITTAMSTLRVLKEGGLTIGGFTLTRTGLQIQAGVQVADYDKVGGIIVDLGKSIQWIIGDWLAFGIERKYGVTYERIAELVGYEVQTLRDLVYVCQNVQLSVRTDKLKFGHHKVVAPLAPHEQAEWLEKAAVGKWSISKLRDEIDAANDDDPPTLPDIEVAEIANNKFLAATAHLGKEIAQFRDSAVHRESAMERLEWLVSKLDPSARIVRG